MTRQREVGKRLGVRPMIIEPFSESISRLAYILQVAGVALEQVNDIGAVAIKIVLKFYREARGGAGGYFCSRHVGANLTARLVAGATTTCS